MIRSGVSCLIFCNGPPLYWTSLQAERLFRCRNLPARRQTNLTYLSGYSEGGAEAEAGGVVE
jgi:hypothetical protein